MRFISFFNRGAKYLKSEQLKQYVPSFLIQKNYYSTSPSAKEELLDAETIRDIKDVFNHQLRIEAAKELAEGRDDSAAKKYDEWFSKNNVLDKIKCFGSSSPSVCKQIYEDKDLKGINDIHLPNVINGFLGCPSENRDDGCKTHLKEISDSGYLKNGHDSLDNSLLHMIARYKNKNNAELIKDLFKVLYLEETTPVKNFLSMKNSTNDSPIEIAFVNNNKMFFELMNNIFGKGFYKIDETIVRNIDYFVSLEDKGCDQELLELSGMDVEYPS